MLHTRYEVPAIDIKHVHYFLMLAKHGSISKAASALGLAQPSLSEHIARLEKKLNTRLAIRGPRGVTLTEAGRFLALEGRTLVDAADNITTNLRQLGDEVAGPVLVGLPPSLSQIASVPLAETVRLETPGIKLHLTEGLSGHIIDWIENDSIDFGFVYANPQNATFQITPVMEEEIFVVAAEDNMPVDPDSNGNYSIRAADLGQLPLVMPGLPHSARRAIEQFARSNGLTLDVVVELNSLSQIVEMVGRASAYTILPHAAVADGVASGRLKLIRIVEPTFMRTAYLARKQTRSASMASMKVEQMVLNIIKEMVERYGLHARYLETSQSSHAA